MNQVVITDQLNRIVDLPTLPRRIISLVPSQTELLYALGLDNEVVGITKFCVHPESWYRSKQRVGGTKQLHLDQIRQLQPDLILANKEENNQDQIEQLSNIFPVWISDVKTLDDAYDMIASIGDLTGKGEEGRNLVERIKSNFENFLAVQQQPKSKPRTCYLIWKDPLMTVGGDTFINSIMEYAGLENIYKDQLRYPEISIHELSSLNCELLLLSSEPFPFKQDHLDELQHLLPGTEIILVDGQIFSWYGSRLLEAPAYISHLRHLIYNS